MKKLHVLLSVLLALLACTILAAADFNAGVEIDRSVNGVISVTVEDSDVLQDKVPSLSVPCDFPYVKVTRGGTVISSDLKDGMVTFPVDRGGVYVIKKTSGVAVDTGSDDSWWDSVGGSSSGTSTVTKNPDGSTTTTTTDKKTGTVTETTKTADGIVGTTVKDKNGNVVSVTASVPATAAAAAAKEDVPVTLPVKVPAVTNTENAPAVKVDVPSGGATVEIPVEEVTPGTVVVIVNADGTEDIVPTSTLTEDGVVVTLEEDATVKVIDNSKDFTDVPETYTLSDSIDFVSARGLFEGNTETTFNPHANTTVAQTMTVLARLSGEDFYGAGATQKGAAWAAEKGLDDGSDVSKPITREQMVVMMWKLAGMPHSDHAIDHHTDDHHISEHAVIAMQWAVEMGILKGNLDGSLNPHGYASRAHVAAFAERYVNAIS